MHGHTDHLMSGYDGDLPELDRPKAGSNDKCPEGGGVAEWHVEQGANEEVVWAGWRCDCGFDQDATAKDYERMLAEPSEVE